MITEPEADEQPHIIAELGLAVRRVDDGLVGTVSITEAMWTPGAACLRTSIVAAWADQLCGLLAATILMPRVPVTIQLDVQLVAPAPGSGQITGVGKIAKSGRSIIFAAVEFSGEDGAVFAVGSGTFMVVPDLTLELPPQLSFDAGPPSQLLSVPFAQRAGCEIRQPGLVVLPIPDDGRNAANTLNGGLIALAAEEAVRSIAPGPTLAAMSIQFLRAVRVGPAMARARVTAAVGQVEVCDQGLDGRVGALVMTRSFAQ
jgi:acyl-coenzyme A thioesterase PaaI-like protein